MVITVSDANGNVLTEDELKSKVITSEQYYTIMSAVKSRLQSDLADKEKPMAVAV